MWNENAGQIQIKMWQYWRFNNFVGSKGGKITGRKSVVKMTFFRTRLGSNDRLKPCSISTLSQKPFSHYKPPKNFIVIIFAEPNLSVRNFPWRNIYQVFCSVVPNCSADLNHIEFKSVFKYWQVGRTSWFLSPKIQESLCFSLKMICLNKQISRLPLPRA